MKIITGFITGWQVASKTASLRAKPIVNLLVDRTVAGKFLVDTLEAKEPIGDGAMFCIGAAGDAWQQMPKKLLAKYDVTAVDADGWMICTPKPDNAVNCVEISKGWSATQPPNVRQDFPDDRMYNLADFAIIGQWGDASYPSLGKTVQWGSIGDFVCQNRTDPTDVWVVRRKLFLNTYILKA
jgi:hypothetical protein